MKRARSLRGDDSIWSPVVLSVLVYGVPVRIAWIWVQCNFRWRESAAWFESDVLLGLSPIVVLTVFDVGFFVLLACELPSARRAAPSVRRARTVAVVLAMRVIVGVQWAAIEMRQVAKVGRLMETPPTVEEVRTEPLSVILRDTSSHVGLDFGLQVESPGHATLRCGRNLRRIENHVPEASRIRLGELLLRERIWDIDGERVLVTNALGPDEYRSLSVRVGSHRHEVMFTGPPAESYTPVRGTRPDAIGSDEFRRASVIRVEVLSWFDDPDLRNRFLGESYRLGR